MTCEVCSAGQVDLLVQGTSYSLISFCLDTSNRNTLLKAINLAMHISEATQLEWKLLTTAEKTWNTICATPEVS